MGRRRSHAMDPLERIRSHIADFAGFDGAEARRRSDQQIRSYAGEKLIPLRDGSIPDDRRQLLDRLLLRSEFANQRAFHGFDDEASAEQIARVAAADADLLDAADAGDLDALDRAYDARDAAMQGQ